MKRLLSTLVILVVLTVIVVAGMVGARSVRPVDSQPTLPPSVQVTYGDVEKTVTLPGQMMGTRRTYLSFGVPGKISQINVRPGARVQAGDILASLDPAPLETAFTQAEINLRITQLQLEKLTAPPDEVVVYEAEAAAQEAEAAVQQAWTAYQTAQANLDLVKNSPEAGNAVRAAQTQVDATYQVYQNLQARYDEGTFHDRDRLNQAHDAYLNALGELERAKEKANLELQQARNEATQTWYAYVAAKKLLERPQDTPDEHDIEMARLEVQAAELALEKARADRAAISLLAPFEGVVLDVATTPGEWTTAGKMVIELTDPTAVEVVATAIEEDLPLIHINQPASLFLDAIPEADLTGRVTRIVPRRVLGEGRPLYQVYLALDSHSADLLPGMTVDAVVTIERRLNVLRIPRALVRRRGDTPTVLVLDGTTIHERTVHIGLTGDLYVEIIDGLNKGEQVVSR